MAWHKIREGYWKSQPCGPGREDRKDIYVKPKYTWAPDVNNYMEEKEKADIASRNYELQKQKDKEIKETLQKETDEFIQGCIKFFKYCFLLLIIFWGCVFIIHNLNNGI